MGGSSALYMICPQSNDKNNILLILKILLPNNATPTKTKKPQWRIEKEPDFFNMRYYWANLKQHMHNTKKKKKQN